MDSYLIKVVFRRIPCFMILQERFIMRSTAKGTAAYGYSRCVDLSTSWVKSGTMGQVGRVTEWLKVPVLKTGKV
jgi:hypothetical protein